MLSREELAAWLRLATTVGIGRATARRLLAAFGSPERVLAADDDTLRSLVGNDAVDTLKHRDARDEARLTATLRWLDASTATVPHDIVTLGDPRYPALLLETADPPLLLFTRGRAELLSAPGIAIVGSRRATPQGLENAHEFARFLSERSLAVISGLALGIDGAAHQGALAGPGSTIAFVGTGLDRVYPPKHAELTRRIAEQGLVASEYAVGPRRCRTTSRAATG